MSASKKKPAGKLPKKKKRSFFGALGRFLLIGLIALAILGVGGYILADYAVTRYFDSWGNRLAELERRGLLSKEVGAGWEDVLTGQTMDKTARRIIGHEAVDTSSSAATVDGIVISDYPSLSIIDRLREIRHYSNSIEITDRNDRRLAIIKTDHSRARAAEFPPVLVSSLIAAEDRTFMKNDHGFEFGSFVRAAARTAFQSVFMGHRSPLRGTSTITQQVAKLFISRLDASGRRHVTRSFDRKLRELKLAAALRKLYSPDDILEVYLNHCVTSDYGLVGFKDIAQGLFDKDLSQLTDAQCVYLSRMVKWGRNTHQKIAAQCRIDMPRIGGALGWDAAKQAAVLAEIDTLSFSRPRRIDATYGSLVDCANEFWLMTLRHNGFSSEDAEHMDFIDPSSLIRKKGNLKISLSIDAPLQKEIEALVNDRGYGPDRMVATEVRIASSDTVIKSDQTPVDTIGQVRVLREPIDFREQGGAVMTTLNPGDTVLDAITFKRLHHNRYRRTLTTSYRKSAEVSGQYFAYAAMDSKTGQLLAYYSKDKLGSRLAGLLRNRIPNGSSTAKPVFNALNFDVGNFMPYSKWSDSVEVLDNVPWQHTLERKNGKLTGVVFLHSAVPGRGYPVHNHENIFEGCQYLFDQLAASDNIFGVESEYRLNRRLFDDNGEVSSEAFPLVQFCYRIGAFSRIKDSLKLKTMTGVRAYKELARLAGVDEDSLAAASGKLAMASDSMYSAALGTLELSLYEQMHLFNMLYNNDLIIRPADHPSLVLASVVLDGDTVAMNDTVARVHPFSDINNLRPTWLGLHKRLISNPGDGLAPYDIPASDADSGGAPSMLTDGKFHPEVLMLREPPSNIAKSGTSDDVIKPFDAPPNTARRTNYGLWNAVIRIDLSKLSGEGAPDVRDVTIACIGECNYKFTGPRDGKTLHRFLTAELLKKAGVPCANGFFSQYESYIRHVTPSVENCGLKKETAPALPPSLDKKGD
jgi:hypothetical protein